MAELFQDPRKRAKCVVVSLDSLKNQQKRGSPKKKDTPGRGWLILTCPALGRVATTRCFFGSMAKRVGNSTSQIGLPKLKRDSEIALRNSDSNWNPAKAAGLRRFHWFHGGKDAVQGNPPQQPTAFSHVHSKLLPCWCDRQGMTPTNHSLWFPLRESKGVHSIPTFPFGSGRLAGH